MSTRKKTYRSKNPVDTLRQIEAAKDQGATHLIVRRPRDGKPFMYEPVIATKPDDVILRVNKHDDKARVEEIYDLGANIRDQLRKVRAWNPPRNRRPT